MAATIVSFVYILGYFGAWLGPETKGQPLPEETDSTPATLGVEVQLKA